MLSNLIIILLQMNGYVKDLEIRGFDDDRIIKLKNLKMIKINKKKKKKINKNKSKKIKNEIKNKLKNIDKNNKLNKKTLYRKIKKISVNSKWRDALKKKMKQNPKKAKSKQNQKKVIKAIKVER